MLKALKRAVAGALLGPAAAATIMATPVVAAPIAPVGTTDVTVDGTVLALLGSAGVAANPIDPATQSVATFSFPITGGDTDTLTITHSGGVEFSRGASFLSASNFVINGSGGTVSATVDGSIDLFNGGPIEAAIFDLAAVDDQSDPITATLLINSTLNDVFSATFAEGDLGLTGAPFGVASTSPETVAPVPVPASALLLVGALGGLAALRRRRAAA